MSIGIFNDKKILNDKKMSIGILNDKKILANDMIIGFLIERNVCDQIKLYII